jgi:serine/threonine-protein kinase
VRTTIAASGAAALTISGSTSDLAITPDGSRVVYAGNNGTQLFVRALDALEPVAIAAGAIGNVFMSPDGQWVGFGGTTTGINKVSISGGPPIRITGTDGRGRGATWTVDDTIIFATDTAATGLQRVSAAGGEVTVLTRPDRDLGEADHLWPETLPGGRAVLFTIMPTAGGLDAAQIAVLDLSTGTQTTLVRGGTHARYVHSGHLVYSAGSALRAVGFDLDRLETRGSPVPVLSHLVTTPAGAADFAVAADGTLVYVDAPAGVGGAARTLAWVDRMGREQPIAAPPRAYMHPRLSPDATRVAVWVDDQESDIWMWDLARATLSRFTFHPGVDNFPVWTPDGRRVIFGSDGGGGQNLFWQAADGTGTAERLTESNDNQFVSGVSPDGAWVIFGQGTVRDVMMTTLTRQGPVGSPSQATANPQARSPGDVRPPSQGFGAPRPLVQTRFEERNGIVSPDGRWLAYESDASGRFEVYVRPFPNVTDGQWQVSTAGGSQPLWTRDGNELFYFAADGALTAVSVEARGAGWSAGAPAKILEAQYFGGGLGATTIGRTYDVSPDGRRFLMIKEGSGDQSSAPPQIVVVQNWHEELKRLVPVN